ncbi:hypothetical protein [Mesorhizobium sp. M0129]|uniref:hypothetical protein n=1 Tax=Mesorhizobium sp. M0129 TaxID=2956886 RepID=UPI003334E272
MLDRTNRSPNRPAVAPPLNRQGIENARAHIRRIAAHFIGTDDGRALEVADRLLSAVKVIPESSGKRQGERGYRLRYLREDLPRYAECNSVRSFVRAFLDDAHHYLKHRSKYDDKLTGLPRLDPWLSVARIIELCDGDVPSFDTIRRDLR